MDATSCSSQMNASCGANIESSNPPPLSQSEMDGSHHIGVSSNHTPFTNIDGIDIDKENEHENEDSVVNGIGRKRKLTSVVWNHFKREMVGLNWKAICNYCQRKLSADSKNGTKHLHLHLNNCPLRYSKDIKQAMLNPTKTNDGKTHLFTQSFNQESTRIDLAKAIIMHEYPLCMVEHKGFKRFMNTAQPLFKMPCRNTIRADIFRIYEEEKKQTYKLLERNKSRVAITTDMWTATNQKRGYMSVTTHFIDDSWQLQSRIMRFLYVPAPHTGEIISKILLECFMDWNIDRKLTTLTVDNCKTNDNVIDLLLDKLPLNSMLMGGRLFHMRCSAHVLNLIVKDGLQTIAPAIERIRESVNYWTLTQKRVEKFEETARQLNIPCSKKLCNDVKTRWNSTFLMLTSAFRYIPVFSRLKQRDLQYTCWPLDEDWVFAKDICEKLEYFYEATKMFSGSRYPTANLFFEQICEIHLAINEWKKSTKVIVRNMATSMMDKFSKYWEDIHIYLSLAVVLDPRWKMNMILCYFPMIYGDDAEFEIDRVRSTMYDLVNEYQQRSFHEDSAGKSKFVDCSISSHPSSTKILGHSRISAFLSTKPTVRNSKSDFDMYLEEPLLPITDDFNILVWWKTHGFKYPILHEVAKDILAIPVSTVASESAFSTGGRVVSKVRNRLLPETLEALMCSQDWVWASFEDVAATTSSSSTMTSNYEYSRIYEDDKDEGVFEA